MGENTNSNLEMKQTSTNSGKPVNPINLFVRERKELFWDVSEKALDLLSEDAIVERVLSFGDWSDCKKLEKILGIKREQEIFLRRSSRDRTNFRPETISFFTDYFGTHA